MQVVYRYKTILQTWLQYKIAVNEMARPLAFAGFNAAMRCNVMKNKMSEPEFLNWLQGKYRDVMHGQVYAEILPYLYNHLPDALEMRIRIAAPADLDAFFNELQKLADIAVRLGYTGDITNPVAIHTFIESDLTRKTGHSKNKCPRSRRAKKVNNTHIVDYEESESDEETDEETEEELTEEEEEEDEPQNCFSKTDEVFHAALKSIIASLAAQCPKEILLQINAYTNQAYENLKDPLLNHFVSDYPVSKRKKL
ncbi:hypothetical protein GLOIN_2v1772633 [Rhizophagus irregularis DAOM 181602=DAOM 197198]|nr:hypothetical protein GLOIN_2v1772633 [Rhizophagus irregularis DAOM 181602=DAOM 197198]